MARGEKRDSGIDVVGELPWGTHFCQFYGTREDMVDIVVPYLRAGLDAREACVWVTSDVTPEAARAGLARAVPRFEEYAAKGQVQILPHTEWYLKGGRFDLQRTLDMWKARYDEALAAGYTGLRVTGNPYWIDNKADWDDFAEYEAEINRVIVGTRMLVLCTYALAKCGVAEILDVVKNHEFAVARNRGAWQVVRMPERLEHLPHTHP